MSAPICRFCRAPLEHTFCDLGMSPFSNAFLTADQLNAVEPFYPLHAYVCRSCFLVQLQVFQSPEQIFSDYAYFSSYSDSWLAHANAYAGQMTQRFGLGPASQVVEIASNDGYLLQYFKSRGIPVLGIEPAANVAAAAAAKGISTVVKFFGTQSAAELAAASRHADLLIGNNVLAHVPDLNDFVAGLGLLLKPSGIVTMEFPHLLRLMEETQFDTIYHEHFSYFSFTTVARVFAHHGLTLFDVEELPTHGGSLRIYACHAANTFAAVTDRVTELKRREARAGLGRIETYSGFGERVKETKRALLEFMISARRQGKRLAGYGAAAKGNTLLNYCGIRGDFLDYVVDRNPHKQHRFLPGTHVPVLPPDKLLETKPDYLLILPWNLKAEIIEQMAHIRQWGGRFVVPIPGVEVLP